MTTPNFVREQIDAIEANLDDAEAGTELAPADDLTDGERKALEKMTVEERSAFFAEKELDAAHKWWDPGLSPRLAADDSERWVHESIEFRNDLLAVRKPQMQALGGYQLATSGFMSDEKKTKYTGLFIARHLSDETWARVMDRLMDPDDPDYDEDAIGDLMNRVVELNEATKPAPQNRKQRRAATRTQQ